MFGRRMQLPKRLALTGLREILSGTLQLHSLQSVWIAKIKYAFEAFTCRLLEGCFLLM